MSETTVMANNVPHEIPEGFQGREVPETAPRLVFHGHAPPVEDVLSPHAVLGGGIRLVYRQKKQFGHREANWVLEDLKEFSDGKTPVDRALRDNHVEYLIGQAKGGTFHPEWVQIISCVCEQPFGDKPAGAEYRMNGQHTAWMRSYMPADWPCPVEFLKYQAATVADMRILYASIDRGAPRTPANVRQAYLAGTPEYAGCQVRVLRAVVRGAALWLFPETGGTVKIDPARAAAAILTEYKEVAVRVAGYMGAKPQKELDRFMTRAAVVAAMMETFQKLPTRAPEFWDGVVEPLGITNGNDPRMRLHNALRDSVISGKRVSGKSYGSGKRAVTSEETYAVCVSCWNAWRKGEAVERVQWAGRDQRPKAR